MLRDVQELKTRLASSPKLDEVMLDFFDFVEQGDLLERSVAVDPPPTLKAILETVAAEVLGKRTTLSGLTLRCGDLLHGAGLLAGSAPLHLVPMTFVYAEDEAIGLACFTGLPNGEARYTRFRHPPHGSRPSLS